MMAQKQSPTERTRVKTTDNDGDSRRNDRKQPQAERSRLSNEELVELYRQMVLIRRCQEMYTRAKIGGFLHLYVGEEATGVGAISALQPQDHIFTHYRDHGHAIAR